MKILKAVALTLSLTVANLANAGLENLKNVERVYNTESVEALENLAESLQGYDSYVAKYRLASRYFGEQKMEKSKQVLASLVSELEGLVKLNYDAEIAAFLADIFGFSIGVDPSLAVDYAPKSQAMIEKAYADSPRNPRVMLFKGNLDYNTPAMFGGNKLRAQEVLTNAIEVFENDASSERYWGHADAYILLGLTYLEQGKLTQARDYWDKAVSINPNNAWAGYLLKEHK